MTRNNSVEALNERLFSTLVILGFESEEAQQLMQQVPVTSDVVNAIDTVYTAYVGMLSADATGEYETSGVELEEFDSMTEDRGLSPEEELEALETAAALEEGMEMLEDEMEGDDNDGRL
jgi:c-di-GMP-related signal transduction protein